jgi:hypothetical protein
LQSFCKQLDSILVRRCSSGSSNSKPAAAHLQQNSRKHLADICTIVDATGV